MLKHLPHKLGTSSAITVSRLHPVMPGIWGIFMRLSAYVMTHKAPLVFLLLFLFSPCLSFHATEAVRRCSVWVCANSAKKIESHAWDVWQSEGDAYLFEIHSNAGSRHGILHYTGEWYSRGASMEWNMIQWFFECVHGNANEPVTAVLWVNQLYIVGGLTNPAKQTATALSGSESCVILALSALLYHRVNCWDMGHSA